MKYKNYTNKIKLFSISN